MRNISVAYTKHQIRDRSKTVTRRTGWLFLKEGDVLQPVEKCMGFKKGESIVKVGCPIEVAFIRREPIADLLNEFYGKIEAEKEGFPHMSGKEFYDFFVSAFKLKPSAIVTRIHFEYLPNYGK